MRPAAIIFLLGLLAGSSGARNLRQQGEPDEGELWAVLIAGSAGYGNYRHQADVAHAYQVLRRGGVPADRIITFMYDDVARSEANPHPGKLFNRPGGPDVYQGVQIDYSHSEVTAANFLAVLAGNATTVPPPSRHSSGRVLGAGPADKVFVYYSDHGAPGILGMPSGPFLYADQLNAVVADRRRRNGFAEMVIYIEACESGSIFEGLLADDISVYATTAANGHESSWGTYCPGMFPSPPHEFGTCLGDLYSVAWLENADSTDLTIETLKKQFQLVKQRVSQNFTYSQGSHVLRFGAVDISEEPAAEFEGHGNTALAGGGGGSEGGAGNGAGASWAPLGAVAQRDADLLHLLHRYTAAGKGPSKAEALRALDAEVSRRAEVDAGVRDTVAALLAQPSTLSLLHAGYEGQLAPEHAALLAAAAAGAASDALLELMVGAQLLRPAGAALVDDWECLRGMVGAWEGSCGPLDQYGMRHSRAFANLCNAGLRPDALGAAAARRCGGASPLVLAGPDAHVAAA